MRRQRGINLDDDLVARLDEQAQTAGISRTALIEHYLEHGLAGDAPAIRAVTPRRVVDSAGIDLEQSVARHPAGNRRVRTSPMPNRLPVPALVDHDYKPKRSNPTRCDICGRGSGHHGD